MTSYTIRVGYQDRTLITVVPTGIDLHVGDILVVSFSDYHGISIECQLTGNIGNNTFMALPLNKIHLVTDRYIEE
jgi:hypothetical protein